MSNWRNVADYPTELPLAQWRWQFIRRRADYQADWITLPKTAAQRVLIPGPPPRMVTLYQAAGIREKYAIAWMADPALEWVPANVTGRATLQAPEPLDLDALKRAEREGYAVVLVDLTAPISDVSDCVARLIPALAQDRETPKVGKRRADKWPLYLRVLDAIADGVTPAEIAEQLSREGPATEDKQARRLIAAAKKASAAACKQDK